MRYDAWMKECFSAHNSSWAIVRMSSALCVLWSDCTCEKCGVRQVYLFGPPFGCHFPASGKKKGISELRDHKCSVQSKTRIAKNSNFCSTSNHRVAPTGLTRTNVLESATGFSVTSKDRFSILFGHRHDNYILHVLQIGGSFAVLIVVQGERVRFLLKSLSHVHHAVCSFLVLLQRNPVVNSLVLEHLSLRSLSASCCNIGVVFQCKLVILNSLLFSPPIF